MPNWGFVWMVAWPDLRARLTRFSLIGLAMAVVLSITLLLSAFSEGFNLRGERLLAGFGGDEYLVAAGSSGPMTATTPLPGGLVETVRSDESVLDARGLFLAPTALLVDGAPAGVVVVGTDGGDQTFDLLAGRGIAGPGEAVVDTDLEQLALGDDFFLAGVPFRVVGLTEFATWDVASAGVFIERAQALDLFAGGRDVVTAIAIDGRVDRSALPANVEIAGRSAAFDDIVSRAAAAKRSIDSFTATLWVLAVMIVGSVLYLAALERLRDFAVFKATGASDADLVLGLAVQAMIVGGLAGLAAIGLAHALRPVYPGLLSLPLRIAWPVVPVAVVIAAVSSVFGIRRAVRVDPSQAFG
ncbi:MAG: ABC transporter permease [Ilumatobacter sp.]|nr:ABC transporter permease [Ilumatobacter sp.]